MHLNKIRASKNLNIYDFLDEIDESADDLYKIHTGRKIFDDRIPSPDDISTSDFDDENKPPPFPYEYVMSNLVEYNEPIPSISSHLPKLTQIKEGNSTSSKSTTMNLQTPETIANALRKLVFSRRQCSVCNIRDLSPNSHYRNAAHFQAIRKWIQKRLAKVEEPVEARLIFCEPCHLALSGNESSKKHYLEASHKKNMKTFCSTCLRVIVEAKQMDEHRKSQQHKTIKALNINNISVGSSLNDNLNCNRMGFIHTYGNNEDRIALNDSAQPPETSTVGSWDAFGQWQDLRVKKNDNGTKDNHISTNSSSTSINSSTSTNDRIVKLAAASQLQITKNDSDLCGPSKELDQTGAFHKQEQENTGIEEQPNTSTFKKTTLKETDETCNLSNWELQRLVLLEQLELVRLQKEKERVLLNSAWWDCGKK